jgi:hypothetical protein
LDEREDGAAFAVDPIVADDEEEAGRDARDAFVIGIGHAGTSMGMSIAVQGASAAQAADVVAQLMPEA